MTGERIKRKPFKPSEVSGGRPSEPVFVLKDIPNTSALILNHPAKKCMEMLQAAEVAGESVNLEDLRTPTPKAPPSYAWQLYIPTTDEVENAISKANEPFCDKGVWQAARRADD